MVGLWEYWLVVVGLVWCSLGWLFGCCGWLVLLFGYVGFCVKLV